MASVKVAITITSQPQRAGFALTLTLKRLPGSQTASLSWWVSAR